METVSNEGTGIEDQSGKLGGSAGEISTSRLQILKTSSLHSIETTPQQQYQYQHQHQQIAYNYDLPRSSSQQQLKKALMRRDESANSMSRSLGNSLASLIKKSSSKQDIKSSSLDKSQNGSKTSLNSQVSSGNIVQPTSNGNLNNITNNTVSSSSKSSLQSSSEDFKPPRSSIFQWPLIKSQSKNNLSKSAIGTTSGSEDQMDRELVQSKGFFNWNIVKSLSKSNLSGIDRDSSSSVPDLSSLHINVQSNLPHPPSLSLNRPPPSLSKVPPEPTGHRMKIPFLNKGRRGQNNGISVNGCKSGVSDPDEDSTDLVSDLPSIQSKYKVQPLSVDTFAQFLLDDAILCPAPRPHKTNTKEDVETSIEEGSHDNNDEAVQKSMIILDMRPFVSFNMEHIAGSFNISIPSLMLQRIRRGSLQFLNLEKFICGEEGRKRWRERSSEKIVIVDEILPHSEKDVSSPEFRMGPVGLLFSSLQRDMEQTTWKGRVFWLKGGYVMFKEYCERTTQTIVQNGESVVLLNSRWIDVQADMNGDTLQMDIDISLHKSRLIGDGKPGGLKLMGSNDPIGVSTPNLSSSTHKMSLFSFIGSKLGSLTKSNSSNNLKNEGGMGEYGGSNSPIATRDLSLSLVDYSVILPWLYLGSDIAVLGPADKDNKRLNGDGVSNNEDDIVIDLPSPVLPKPLLETREKSMGDHVGHATTKSSGGQRLYLKATAQKIKQVGISFIVNMANECPDLKEHFEKYQKKEDGMICLKGYLKQGIYDYEDEDIEHAIHKVIHEIDEYHEKNPEDVVYVHCRAGRSRSATIVIAYLMKANKWRLQQAYEYVRIRRPIISPNLGFMGALDKLDKQWSLPLPQTP